MPYLPMEEVFNHIRSREEPGQYFFVNKRGDLLGYVLTRAGAPEEKRVVRVHTKLNLRRRGG